MAGLPRKPAGPCACCGKPDGVHTLECDVTAEYMGGDVEERLCNFYNTRDTNGPYYRNTGEAIIMSFPDETDIGFGGFIKFT